MCLATQRLNELEEWCKRLEEDFAEIRKLHSEIDKELSDKYHEIEGANFNVVNGYKLAKSLQDILQKRRTIKGEAAKLNAVISVANNKLGEGGLLDIKKALSRAVSKDAEIRAKLKGEVAG